MTKRIVFQETQGANRGLHHIMGTTDELDGAEPPDFVEGAEVHGRITSASLIQSKARYVLYREVLADGMGSTTPDPEDVL